MGSYPKLFETFWSLYPTRNGKRLGKVATFKKWQDLSEEDKFACCRAAGVYAEFYKRPLQPKEFRAEPRDPERFLRNDWWRDWLTTDDAKQCNFKQVGVSCEEMALPGDRVCKQHREFLDKMEKIRKRDGLA